MDTSDGSHGPGRIHHRKGTVSKRELDTLTRAKFRGAGSSERFDRRLAVWKASAGKPKKFRSEKARSRWRRDLKRDEDIFLFINGLLRKSQPIQVTEKLAHTVRAVKRILEGAKPAKIVPPVGLPHWDHAAQRLKMLGWGMASWELNATPFTLRLSDAVILQAKRDTRGFARHIQDRIRRHVKYHTGDDPSFWFSVEKGPFEEPHLHGAIVVSRGQDKTVRRAMRAAGGKWTSSARQFHFSPKRGAIGWVGYCTKWMYGNKRRLRDDRLTAASHSIRAAAQKWFQSARKAGKVLYPL